MLIRLLQQEDAASLLRFELANRHWFERHIASRGDAFYSAEGVGAHIHQLLEAHSFGRFHPCVIIRGDGTIAGRANLKDIDLATGMAEVGYRIAETETGRGLATAALQHLTGLARTHWALNELCAYVSVHNLASQRVLERCGFQRQPSSLAGSKSQDLLLTLELK